MRHSSESIEETIELFAMLPTIGRKTAQRLTFYLLRQSDEMVERFSTSLTRLKQNVRFCSVCFNFTETDPCMYCSSTQRKREVICVVEEPMDVVAIEKTREFNGLYHVLHGSLNPLEGIGADDIKLKELVQRLDGSVSELILALNPNVEGEVTTQYIAKLVKPLGVNVTRIARGIPIGTDLEFVDDATLVRSILGRQDV